MTTMRNVINAALTAAFLAMPAVAARADQKTSIRIVTSSDVLKLTKGDHTLGLRRIEPRAGIAVLPVDADPDQEFVIDDLAGNLSQFPVTVLTSDGRKVFVLSVDWGHAAFRYFGDDEWGVEQ